MWGDPDSNWVIFGNHPKDADTDVASIFSGPTTSLCFVVVNTADVLDLGTDNKVLDVPATHFSGLGPQVREALADQCDLKS
jgi:hypothetical protein